MALLVSAIGFKKYVWFISLGYGFSIAAEGIAMLILYCDSLTVTTVLLAVIFVLYGLRLSGYLAIREAKSAFYKKHMTSATKDGTEATHFGYLFGAADHTEHGTAIPMALKRVTVTGGTVFAENAFADCVCLWTLTCPQPLLRSANSPSRVAVVLTRCGSQGTCPPSATAPLRNAAG